MPVINPYFNWKKGGPGPGDDQPDLRPIQPANKSQPNTPPALEGKRPDSSKSTIPNPNFRPKPPKGQPASS